MPRETAASHKGVEPPRTKPATVSGINPASHFLSRRLNNFSISNTMELSKGNSRKAKAEFPPEYEISILLFLASGFSFLFSLALFLLLIPPMRIEFFSQLKERPENGKQICDITELHWQPSFRRKL